MLFWTAAAILTLVASLAVLLPLAGARGRAAGAARNEIEVYRDQLAEVERDLKRDLLDAGEAEQARAEIARRIIKADAATALPSSRGKSARALAAAGVLCIPLVSWGLYGAIGSPQLPSQPLSERMSRAPADSSIDELVARAEAQLAANPDDLRGWEVLAPIYFRMGRFEDAVAAYRNAIRLGGATAARQAGLGEALAYAAGGLVTAEASAAFEAALQAAPGYPKARFFLAMAKGQDGKREEAAADWMEMAAALPEDDPWRAAAQAAAEVARQDGAPQPGGSPDQAAIEQMVAGLDQRLRENPEDAEGWKRLVRSYVVLGRQDKARDALTRALEALGGDSAAGKDVVAFAAGQGVRIE